MHIATNWISRRIILRRLAEMVFAASLVSPTTVRAAEGGPSELPITRPVKTCSSLQTFDLVRIGGEGSAVISASETQKDGIRACTVEGRLAPAVNFRLVLPLETWTQRYLQLGCGGLCGRISLRTGASDGCPVLADGGFAMAATDMGHSGGFQDDGSWGLDAQKRVDFAYRAQHLTALASKALIATFYGKPAKYAYFNGCSDGGREALMEAMRFPDDFNGIVAGAPAMLFVVQNTLFHAWQAVSNMDAAGRAILLANRLPVLHKAVLAACDAADGARDGIIANPAACTFDPRSIVCKPDAVDKTACLTQDEAEVARKFYEGPKDAVSGAFLTPGQPLFGSELEWQGVYVPNKASETSMSVKASVPVIRYFAHEQARPNAMLSSFRFNEEALSALRRRHALFDASNPDLKAFKQSGGKLILWHGMGDPHIAPATTLAFHKAMVSQMGAGAVSEFERLYFLPGVAHCGGGFGPGSIDLLTPMMAWVENGVAPGMVATRTTGVPSEFGRPVFDKWWQRLIGYFFSPPSKPKGPAMARPVYPYPVVARYKGTGEVYDAINWEAGEAIETIPERNWPGRDLFEPKSFSVE